MTVKHSRKMAQGSVFYLCTARDRGVEQGAAAGLRTECSARYCHGDKRLRGVPCHRRALEGRRILPPVQCRSTGYRWRERPPSCARSLTPGAPRGVVHATDAPCQWSQNLDAKAPMFRVPSARTLRRPRAAEVALNPRGDHSASLVEKESLCQ
jgi:hypothetical protein